MFLKKKATLKLEIWRKIFHTNEKQSYSTANIRQNRI